MKRNVLLAWLRERKRIETFDGGREVVFPVERDLADGFGTFDGYDKLGTTRADVFGALSEGWVQWYAGLSTCGREELENSGEAQVFNLIKAKMNALTKSTTRRINDMLINSTGEFNPDWGQTPMLGLEALIGNEWKSPELHGIDSSKPGCEWWRSTIEDGGYSEALATGAPLPGPFELTRRIFSEVTTCVGEFSTESDMLLLMDKKSFLDLRESARDRYTTSDDMAVIGFKDRSMMIDGISAVWDSAVPENTIYVLSAEALTLYVHSRRWFSPTDWRAAKDQDARCMYILGAGQFTTNARFKLGQICNFTVAPDCLSVRVC